jgi:ATP-dependent RNA helicase RhlE
VKFSLLEILILDEADRMLDLGFSEEIQKILTLLPKRRQNLLFSATFPPSVRVLAEKLLYKPLRIEVDPPNSAAKNVRQWVYEVDKRKKPELLAHLLRTNDWQQVLVFIRTRVDADRLVGALSGKGIAAVAIHGDKSQGTRTKALADFKAGSVRVLVATDIVARGLDIIELSHVINVDLPKVAEDYIHRIGRTGRAGLEGTAISLVSADEVNLLSAIETLLRRLLVREVVDGFLPRHSVPLTALQKLRPKKPKKPKKESVPPQVAQQDPPPAGKNIHRKPRRGEAATGEKPVPADTRRHQRSIEKNVVAIKEKKGRGR